MKTRAWIAILPLLAQRPIEPAGEAGGDPVGRPAPSLAGVRWLDREPIRVADLRGKVVLIRWWTDGCSLCTATAPAIRELAGRFGDRGLEVLAIYHPKPAPRAVSDESARRAAARAGYPFALGVDSDWEALRRWWLDGARRRYTSVTFLLDRAGAIAFVHDGGEFHRGDEPGHSRCARDFERIEATIERLVLDGEGAR